MAEKRMFSNKITQSDAFLSMPASSQNLYWHLSMDADDDGFVNRPKSIMRMVNANEDDMNILITRKFIIPFEVEDQDSLVSMICVIKHWFIHNTIRSDRKKDTTYIREKNMLLLNENGSYSLHKPSLQPSDNQVTTNCRHRLVETRLDKSSIDKTSKDEKMKKRCNIKMLLANGNKYEIDNKFYEKLISVYTNSNIDLELNKMSLWLETNPTKRKTKKGMPRFINSWLSRANDSNAIPVKSNHTAMPEYSNDVEIEEDVDQLLKELREEFK